MELLSLLDQPHHLRGGVAELLGRLREVEQPSKRRRVDAIAAGAEHPELEAVLHVVEPVLQLTHLGGFATFPDFSPDASKIAFAGSEGNDPNGEIYVVNARTGGSLHALTSCASFAPGCFNDLPVWSPDGTKIAFIHADDSNDEGVINQQVWVMDSDGQHQHPLTSSPVPHDQVADWSPDGSKIVFHAGGFGSGGIWVMNADGSDQHQVSGCDPTAPSPCAAGDDWGPTWSPDGRKIVFLRDLQALGTSDRPIYVMNADGSGQHRITTAPITPGVPAWQPRGVPQGG